MRQKLWSLSSIATELRKNPRTIARVLQSVPLAGKIGRRDAWHLADAIEALRNYESTSPQLGDRRYHNERDAVLDQVIAAAERVDRLLNDMRGEPDLARRRALLSARGACFGELDRALSASADREGTEGAAVLRPYVDGMMAQALQQILSLARWEFVGKPAG